MRSGHVLVGLSGLAMVQQDLMHRITFHYAGHEKTASSGHVPYGGEYVQSNALDGGRKVVPIMTTFTCFNECKEGWNMQNQQPVFIECKMRCEAWEGRLRVHSWIQICLYTSRMRAREKNASHRFFYVYALLFFCMRHLADLVQLQVSSVGRRLFKQAVKASSIVPFFCPSCPP